MMNAKAAALALAAGLLVSQGAQAAFQRFDLKWGGQPGQPAAIGYVVLDTALLPSSESGPYPGSAFASVPSAEVSDLRLTVTGSFNGDGTYGMDSYASLAFWTPGGIDLTKELVGQKMGNGWTFGVLPDEQLISGDFALTPRLDASTAPYSMWYYNLSVGDRSGACCQQLQLVSMLPVPEPASVALAGLGVVVLLPMSYLRRRRQRGLRCPLKPNGTVPSEHDRLAGHGLHDRALVGDRQLGG